MQKDKSYHEAAIFYNEEIADFAESLAAKITHDEVKRWPKAVAKQHRFHAQRHQAALAKLVSHEESATTEEKPVPAETEVDYRDAGTGKYVTEEYAEDNPGTTVKETEHVDDAVSETEIVEETHLDAVPVDASPDVEQAAEPVDAGVETPAALEAETYDDGCVGVHNAAVNDNCYYSPNRTTEEG